MTEEGKPGNPVPHPLQEVRLLSVPAKGTMDVRFLAPVRGVLTHWDRGKSWICTIPLEPCEPRRHKTMSIWKGFASIEFFSSAIAPMWIPAVLEVTERLALLLGEQNPRGTIWRLHRQAFKGKAIEVTGNQLGSVDPRSLRVDVDMERVVKRTFRQNVIPWDQPLPFDPPQLVHPCDAVIVVPEKKPATVEAPRINPETGLPFTTREILSEARKNLVGPNSNGKEHVK